MKRRGLGKGFCERGRWNGEGRFASAQPRCFSDRPPRCGAACQEGRGAGRGSPPCARGRSLSMGCFRGRGQNGSVGIRTRKSAPWHAEIRGVISNISFSPCLPPGCLPCADKLPLRSSRSKTASGRITSTSSTSTSTTAPTPLISSSSTSPISLSSWQT